MAKRKQKPITTRSARDIRERYIPTQRNEPRVPEREAAGLSADDLLQMILPEVEQRLVSRATERFGPQIEPQPPAGSSETAMMLSEANRPRFAWQEAAAEGRPTLHRPPSHTPVYDEPGPPPMRGPGRTLPTGEFETGADPETNDRGQGGPGRWAQAIEIAQNLADPIMRGIAAAELQPTFASGWAAAEGAAEERPHRLRRMEAGTRGAEAEADIRGSEAEMARTQTEYLPGQLEAQAYEQALGMDYMQTRQAYMDALTKSMMQRPGFQDRRMDQDLMDMLMRFASDKANRDLRRKLATLHSPEEANLLAMRAQLVGQQMLSEMEQRNLYGAQADYYRRRQPGRERALNPLSAIETKVEGLKAIRERFSDFMGRIPAENEKEYQDAVREFINSMTPLERQALADYGVTAPTVGSAGGPDYDSIAERARQMANQR